MSATWVFGAKNACSTRQSRRICARLRCEARTKLPAIPHLVVMLALARRSSLGARLGRRDEAEVQLRVTQMELVPFVGVHRAKHRVRHAPCGFRERRHAGF